MPPDEITGLIIYGSVFFATASLVEEQLPVVTEETRHAVVILNLEGEDDLGSTFLEILDRYASSLKENQSNCCSPAVSEHVMTQLNQTGIGENHWPGEYLYIYRKNRRISHRRLRCG